MTQVLAGNWKMFKVRSEAEAFFQQVGLQIATSDVRKIVATSPLLIETALEFSTGTGIDIFAQDCSWLPEGALTGDTSARQLADIGVKGTLVGHSERRQFFGDTDERCVKKAELALDAELDVIYCIGESLAERQNQHTEAVLERQLAALLQIADKAGERLILAYEPVWAIGTGLTANSDQIRDAHAFIATLLLKKGLSLPILYGGSVKPANFKEISRVPHVAGGLVGGASLDAKSFIDLHTALLDSEI